MDTLFPFGPPRCEIPREMRTVAVLDLAWLFVKLEVDFTVAARSTRHKREKGL
jgi:hypothetical protein